MLSKQVTKIVQNLEKKKFREKYNLFKIEGEKLVGELLHSPLKIHSLIAFPSWLEQNKKALSNVNIIEADEREMHGISNFQSLPEVIALAEIPVHIYRKEEILDSLSLVLNGIQDPGNLGTIIRLADWFGIEHIFCSNNTVDAFNPKTIQATMGAIARVKLHYCSLYELISNLKDVPVYGTFLDGEDIYTQKLSSNGLIIMGNEGNGISQEVEQLINKRLYIPNYPQSRETSESLNVAIATAIVCSEFRRQAL